MPGMARFVVKKKAATKSRQGINVTIFFVNTHENILHVRISLYVHLFLSNFVKPFTKEPCTFAAKPARKVVKGFVVKAFKEL